MVSLVLDQNLLYIIIAVVVVIVIIIVAALLLRRGSKGRPSQLSKYMASEAELAKERVLEREILPITKTPLYLRTSRDDLQDFKEAVSDVQRKNIYDNRRVKSRLKQLTEKEIDEDLKKQLNSINKRNLELNRTIKPKKDK